ncbi:MAG TPA: VOC family protein [Actinopolymorphaceae bacterium]
MFGTSKAYSGFAVDDIGRADEFYRGTLGLRTTRSQEMGQNLMTVHLADGRDVLVYEKPDFTPATYTILYFPVNDVEAAVDRLAENGITLERYDMVEHDDKGLMRDPSGPAIGWFRDPAGNTLAVLQE